MILISEEKIDDINVKYYDGIDLKMAQEHPKDGSGGFIFYFVENWVSEVKKYDRGSKIDNILSDKEVIDFGGSAGFRTKAGHSLSASATYSKSNEPQEADYSINDTDPTTKTSISYGIGYAYYF